MAKSLEEAQALLQNYRQQNQATQPVASSGETEQEKAKRLLNEYRSGKTASASNEYDGGPKDNAVIKQLRNAGEGAALSFGNTLAGLAQLPVKGAKAISGAIGLPTKDLENISSGIENIRQKAFVAPTQQSQQTIAGKIGKKAADVGQYMAAGPANVGRSVVQDSLIGASQANGDAGAGAAAGAIAALTGGLGTLPATKGIIRKTVQKLAPGYAADVVQGLSGQRGEDRTGGNAFIPGAGTVFSGVLAAGAGAVKGIQKIKNPETYIKAESKAWEVPANEKNAKYDNAKSIQERANNKGIDIQKELVYNQDFAKTNSTKGKLDTVALENRYRTKAADIGKVDITPAIKQIDYSAKHEPISNIFNEARASVKGNLTPTDEVAVLNYLDNQEKALSNKFKDGTLKPSDLYSYKKIYSGNSGYKKGISGDAIAEQGNAILDKVLKDKLVKIGDYTGLPIGDLFKLQEKNYLVADYVKSLDGTKIPLTGIQKARKTGLKLTGVFLGNKAGGLFGAAAGYNAAGAIYEALGSFPNPIKKSILERLQNETPEAQKKLIDFLKLNSEASKTVQQRMLSGKNTIFPSMDTSGIDVQATGELTNKINQQSMDNTLRLPAGRSANRPRLNDAPTLGLTPPNKEYVGAVPYSSSLRNDTSPTTMNISPKKASISKRLPPKKK